jgi:hypothetical protein
MIAIGRSNPKSAEVDGGPVLGGAGRSADLKKTRQRCKEGNIVRARPGPSP